jgi:hypothetical protein
MKLRTLLASFIIVLAFGVALPAWAPAAVVGNITQAEGRVDILKGGKLPATPAKLQDGVEPGDVLRTKSLSKAQITFIDNSVITLSPESRLAVDEYRFDPAQQKRQAVLNIFQGLAHVLVNKLFKVEEPDFVIKSNTAVTGVRGTDFGIRLQANSSTILNFKGLTQVGNIFPEVSNLFPRAFKVAYAFGPPGSKNTVLLNDMQGTTVDRNMPPTKPFSITDWDHRLFMNQLATGLLGRRQGQGPVQGAGLDVSPVSPPAATSSVQAVTSSVPAVAPLGLTTGTGSTNVTNVNTITVPPTVPATSTASGVTSTSTLTSTSVPTSSLLPGHLLTGPAAGPGEGGSWPRPDLPPPPR